MSIGWGRTTSLVPTAAFGSRSDEPDQRRVVALSRTLRDARLGGRIKSDESERIHHQGAGQDHGLERRGRLQGRTGGEKGIVEIERFLGMNHDIPPLRL